MNITLHEVDLPLEHTFTIARGSRVSQPSLIVELEHNGISGFGEVTENEFYGHSFESISASIESVLGYLNQYIDHSPSEVWPVIADAIEGDMFALSAIDISAHDLHGKQSGLPTWKDWGLRWENVPQSSYTIGIDSIETMVEKIKEKPGWGIYKIKLGTPDDLKIITELREHSDAIFRVDANCGWSAEETIDNSKSLAQLGVEFIEQPLPIEAPSADKLKIFEESALPIIADEDCQVIDDIERCHGLFHGVNVKICKCGGLSPALKMLRSARRLGMKTMVGCMIESSIGISGAAHLLPLLDFADLDGAVLLKDEPATGVTIDKGVVKLTERNGTGAQLDFDRLEQF